MKSVPQPPAHKRGSNTTTGGEAARHQTALSETTGSGPTVPMPVATRPQAMRAGLRRPLAVSLLVAATLLAGCSNAEPDVASDSAPSSSSTILGGSTSVTASTAPREANDSGDSEQAWKTAFCAEFTSPPATPTTTTGDPDQEMVDGFRRILTAADDTGAEPPERVADQVAAVRAALESDNPTDELSALLTPDFLSDVLGYCNELTPEDLEAEPRFTVSPLPVGYRICGVIDTPEVAKQMELYPDDTPTMFQDVSLWGNRPLDPLSGTVVRIISPSGSSLAIDAAATPDVELSPRDEPDKWDAIIVFPDSRRGSSTDGGTSDGAGASTREPGATDAELEDAQITLEIFGATESEAEVIAESLSWTGDGWDLSTADLELLVDMSGLAMFGFLPMLSVTDGASTIGVFTPRITFDQAKLMAELDGTVVSGRGQGKVKQTTIAGHPALQEENGEVAIEIDGVLLAVSSIGDKPASASDIQAVAENLRAATADEWNQVTGKFLIGVCP